MIVHVSRDQAGMLVLTCKIGDAYSQQKIDVRSYGNAMTPEIAGQTVFMSCRNAYYQIEAMKKHNQPQDRKAEPNGQR